MTVTSPGISAPPAREARGPRRPSRAALWVLGGGLLLLGAALAIVLWAKTRPSFDSYGWLVWGHQTIAGSLNTNAAPSWKPLPYIFTVPYALFGHYELWLWMVTDLAITLGGSVAAGRIAYRLTLTGPRGSDPAVRRADPRVRYAGIAAGVFTGVALVGIQDWWHYVLSAQSDTMIAALCLGAIDCHLSGRPRWAFGLGLLAALGRPEVWPFLGLYSIWTWRTIPSMRWLIAGGIVALLLLWFGIPALTSRSPFVSASNAFGSGRRLRSDRVFGTIDRFLDLYATPLEIAALISILWAALRRDLAVLLLAAGGAAWVIIEVAFSLHGWPGLGRYMFGAGAVMVVLAGVLVGRLLADLAPLLTARLHRPDLNTAFTALGVVLVALLGASLIPAAVSRARIERRDLRAQRARTKEIDRLAGAVNAYGGPGRLNACGEPLTRLEYQTILAWTLHLNVAAIGFKYGEALDHGNPSVLFTPLPHGGWRVQAVHQRLPQCRALPG
ncbi:MAG: hypothetical protein JO244_11430 [Solirubrobacterales bacterium]|nr:hypothetical protein [Solirubrobacterales bacterium]